MSIWLNGIVFLDKVFCYIKSWWVIEYISNIMLWYVRVFVFINIIFEGFIEVSESFIDKGVVIVFFYLMGKFFFRL